MEPYLLILTNSYDVTTDLLIHRIPSERVFRFNLDLFRQYRIRFDCNGFQISDPTGRAISFSQIHKAYWRKPLRPFEEFTSGSVQEYENEEVAYILREMVNLLWMNHKFVLVEPYAENRTGKLLQLILARKHLHVPDFEFVFKIAPHENTDARVVKSLSGSKLGDRVLYTTRIEPNKLCSDSPWFVQNLVDAIYDLTVVFVRDELFAFRLKRENWNGGIDWREFISDSQVWEKIELTPTAAKAIKDYMAELRLDFGRLDLLVDENGIIHFCEVNPNGQFAWLDLRNENGLLQRITAEISPDTERHAIPNRHPLWASAGSAVL